MSYILEALKKSDRERRQGEVPSLQSDHLKRPALPQKEKKAPSWPWIGAAILVFALVSSLVFYRGGRNGEVPPEKNLGQLPEQAMPPAQPAPAKNTLPDRDKVTGKTVTAGTGSHPKAIPSPDAPEMAVFETGAGTTQPAEVVTDDNRQQPLREEAAMPRPEDLAGSMSPAPPSSAKAVEQDGAADDTDALPLLQDLPAAVRKSLPPLQLAGHVYAQNPAKRLIIINNRICREGDMVDNGLYLDRIIWEGVVLRYQNTRFRMKLL